ncbi:MAG: DEAD/DEAH box helicase, partial [Myxococcota bacterium]|nr:DEAD/DEAH box helicase [Myxococcota bacterium]
MSEADETKGTSRRKARDEGPSESASTATPKKKATRKKASAKSDGKPAAKKKAAARKTATRKKATAETKDDAPAKPARKKTSARKVTRKKATRRVAEGVAEEEDEALEAASIEADDDEATETLASLAEEDTAEAEPPGDAEPADEDEAPKRRGRRKIVASAPADTGPEEISVADLLDDDDELEREAERVATELAKQQDEDDAPEPELPTDLGPVFEGEVPIATSEERIAAMDKAAPRLGIPELRAEQREVIDTVMSGEDVLMILPTGFGKSACYQIPSMIFSKPVLVISPLLALMRDQYEKLQRLNVPCVRLDGTIRGGARKQALEQIESGDRVLVMTTPETLASPDLVAALAKSGIAMAAIDEAHCISEWGFDFRPAYLQIGERLRALGGPPVLALTATATPRVRDQIQRFLGMRDPHVVSTSPHRENLAFDVLPCGGGARHRALEHGVHLVDLTGRRAVDDAGPPHAQGQPHQRAMPGAASAGQHVEGQVLAVGRGGDDVGIPHP